MGKYSTVRDCEYPEGTGDWCLIPTNGGALDAESLASNRRLVRVTRLLDSVVHSQASWDYHSPWS